MTKEKATDESREEKCECKGNCCCGFSIISGFKFGFGMFVAFLAGSAILTIVAVAFYYISKLI